jgi:uncharacterized membrane protein YedE/YeeE
VHGALAFAVGLVFAAGLVLSGMTQPGKVVGFLDFAGAWDPSLAFVMIGAIGVFAPVYAASRRVRAPLVHAQTIDLRLVGGAALFGVGWGLSGYCPGPAIVGLGALAPGAIVLVPAMLVGMWLVPRALLPCVSASSHPPRS